MKTLTITFIIAPFFTIIFSSCQTSRKATLSKDSSKNYNPAVKLAIVNGAKDQQNKPGTAQRTSPNPAYDEKSVFKWFNEYRLTHEFKEGITVEIVGILIDIILLSLLIPVIMWIYNLSERMFSKYHGVGILFSLFNGTLDQIGLLFNYDKIDDGKVDEGATNDNDPAFRYYRKHASELKVEYLMSSSYGNLKPKLYCIEHSCRLGKPFTLEADRRAQIVDGLREVIEHVEKLQFFKIENIQLEQEISLYKALIVGVQKMIHQSATKVSSETLIDSIHTMVLGMLASFYKHFRFYERYEFYYGVKDQNALPHSVSIERVLKKFYKKERRAVMEREIRSEASTLMGRIKQRSKSKSDEDALL